MASLRVLSVFILALAGHAILPATAAEQQGMLSSRDISEKIVGQKMDWRSLEGNLSAFGEILFQKDGRVEMTTNLPGLPSDIGAWWLDDNQICTRWGEARDGEAKCYRLIDQGSGKFLTTGGNLFEIGQDPMV